MALKVKTIERLLKFDKGTAGNFVLFAGFKGFCAPHGSLSFEPLGSHP